MGTITTNILSDNGKLEARKADFVMQFENQWDLLQKIMQIIRMIEKKDGETLTYYTTERVGNLNIQDQEGQATVGTEYKVVEAGTYKIKLERAKKEVTAESVIEYGPEMAIARTDAEFISDLEYVVEQRLYDFLEKGTLRAERPTFVGAMSAAKGVVINRASALRKRITDVVAFAGIMDLYNYLGEQQVTVQTAFGLNYVENFLGYRLIFLLPDTILSGAVYSTPLSNIIGYYIDPSSEGIKQLGLSYTVGQGHTHLIGVATEPDYDHGLGKMHAAMGITLFAERIDFIAKVSINPESDSKAVATLVAASELDTGSPNVGVSDGKRKG